MTMDEREGLRLAGLDDPFDRNESVASSVAVALQNSKARTLQGDSAQQAATPHSVACMLRCDRSTGELSASLPRVLYAWQKVVFH